MPGWKAAILQGLFWPQAIQGNLLAVHYLVLAFANLVMIISPFFMGWGVADVRFVKWLRWLSIGAMVLVWLFLGQLWAIHMGKDSNMAQDLRSGFYLWAGSFVVLTVAAWLQPAVKGKAAETVADRERV